MGIVTAWLVPEDINKQVIKNELKKMLAPFGGIGVFVQKGDRVLLKPDVSLPSLPEEGIITEPLLVEAVIELSLEAGAASVTVAESAASSFDTIKNYCVSGYDYLCEDNGAYLCDSNETKAVLRQIPNALLVDQVQVYQAVLLADTVINLPKLKVLPREGFRCANTNLLGIVPAEEKERLADGDLERALFDLSNLVNPDLTIVDAMCVSYLGEMEPLGLVLLGADMVAIDTIAASVMGYDPRDIEYLQLAEQYGLASANPANITIFGDDLSPLMQMKRGKKNEQSQTH